MKKRIHKLLSLMLTIILVVGMIPMTSLPAFAATGDEVYVGGVAMYDGDYLAVGATATQTTKPSGGYAYYENDKLTLNNYSYEGKGYLYYTGYYAVIYSKNDLTLELIGNNTLAQTEFDSDMIYVDGAKLTVGGDGKLTGTADGYVLFADGDLTINGGTIEVSSRFESIISFDGDVIINGGDITAESENRAAICSNYDVTVNGGNVTAIGANGAIDYFTGFTVAEGMKIQASTTVDGELGEYVSANRDSYKKIVITTPAIYVGGVGMLDGDYLAVGATATQTTKPSGGYAYYKDGKLTLNNYSYEGEGYKYDDYYYAVIYTKNDLTLELIGNNTLTQTASDSDMIYVDGAKLTVGGDGKLTGTPAGYALYADKDITINGGTVEVSTYIATSIVSYGNVIINDGDITAESEDMAAIYSKYDVTVNGGNVTAIGGNGAIDYSTGFTVAEGAKIQASTTVDGELGEYVAANHTTYKKIVINAHKLTAPVIKSSSVANTGKIKLTWAAVEGAAKYRVYRATSKTGKYSIMKTVEGTSYINATAKAGTRYYYYVVSIDANGNVSEKSNIVNRVCDLPRPTVTLSNVASSGKIKVSWTKVDGAAKYQVYRSTTKNGTYKVQKTTTSLSWTDTNTTAGKTYYYKVKAVHSNTNANSALTAYKSRTCDLKRPTVSITRSSGKPKVSWAAVSGATKYKIYRSTSKTGTYSLVKTTTSKSWKDTTAKKGKTYYYKVVAVHKNSSANSAYSTVKSIKCTK